MANSVDPDEMAHYEPSHLNQQFAKVSVLVYRAEKIKLPAMPVRHDILNYYFFFIIFIFQMIMIQCFPSLSTLF